MDVIAPFPEPPNEDLPTMKAPKRTLGNVRLRNHETNEVILVPRPSSAPDDPLNWYAVLFSGAGGLLTSDEATMVQVLHGRCDMHRDDDMQLSCGRPKRRHRPDDS